MLNKINTFMYYSMFAAIIFLMLIGCIEEYEPITMIVLLSGFAISFASFLLSIFAKQIYITSSSRKKKAEHKQKQDGMIAKKG